MYQILRGVNRFSDLCGKSSGFADCENIVDRGSAVIFDADYGLCLSYVRILGPKRDLDHTLSSALISMFMSSSKLFLFSKDVHLNSGVRRLLELYCDLLCCCHQACCLLYYLGEINSGIHMCQFTFEPLHFCFRMWLWFRILNKYFSGSTDLAKKTGTDRRICILVFTPLKYSWLFTFGPVS